MTEITKKEIQAVEQPEPNRSNLIALTYRKPQEIVKDAEGMAKTLAIVIKERKLYSDIQGKQYVRAEGWMTLGAILGVFPTVEWSRRVERENEIVYEARVILKTLNGQAVTAADAMCSDKERNWVNHDEYAIRSMAETRATGKAYRTAFAWIVTLAGFEATPAEEIPSNEEPISQAQKGLIERLVMKHRENGDQYQSVEEFEGSWGHKIADLTKDQASQLIEKLLRKVKLLNDQRIQGEKLAEEVDNLIPTIDENEQWERQYEAERPQQVG